MRTDKAVFSAVAVFLLWFIFFVPRITTLGGESVGMHLIWTALNLFS